MQLDPLGIGVTVVCLGYVRTRTGESGRNRQERYGPVIAPYPVGHTGKLAARSVELQQAGLDPATVAAEVIAAIRSGALYVYTHPEMRGEVDERFAAISAAPDDARR